MVHLLPHWNFRGREGELIKVFAYTNTERLELFLNGKSLGARDIEKFGHGEWYVAYEAGTLEVLAYEGEKIVARDTRVTSKAPYALSLKLDTKDVKANGEDIALFTCSVLDEDGNEVYDAAPTVTFTSNSLGRVYSTGSDVTDHESLFLPTRRMRAGRITVAVKLGEVSGELKLYAESAGLKTAAISVNI
jgi:beta-galactosidase